MTIETLQKDLEEALEENKVLTAVNDQLNIIVEEMSKKTKVSEINIYPLTDKTFEVDGKRYGFAFPATMHIVDGAMTKVTPDHVLASEALQNELVNMGSGFVVKK